MAFVVEQEKNGLPWVMILTGIVVVALLGTAVYYLFFTEAPLIETLTSRSYLELSATEFETVNEEANQETIINHQAFKNLREQAAPISVGILGKSNPFQSF